MTPLPFAKTGRMVLISPQMARAISPIVLSGLLALAPTGCRQGLEIEESVSTNFIDGETSKDLEADIQTMWTTTPPTNGRDWSTATEEAVSAADRVFNTVQLVGMSKDRIPEILHFALRDPDYGYYAPFWPRDRGDIVIRIDTGAYGWQFNLKFDQDNRVREVVRQWIH